MAVAYRTLIRLSQSSVYTKNILYINLYRISTKLHLCNAINVTVLLSFHLTLI